MERAAITPITMRREVIRTSHHAITGSVISSLPLKIVAITAGPTEIARTAIDLASAIPIAGMVPGLAPTNQVCANLTSSITMSTRATRIDLARLFLAGVLRVTNGTPHMDHSLIRKTHAGRVGRTNLRADLKADLKNSRDPGRTLSSSRAITSALMLPTLLRVPLGSMQIRANAM